MPVGCTTQPYLHFLFNFCYSSPRSQWVLPCCICTKYPLLSLINKQSRGWLKQMEVIWLSDFRWPFFYFRNCNLLHSKYWLNNNNNRFMALYPGLPGWAGTRRNIHPLTDLHHRPTFISFFHLPRSIASSLFNLRAWQSFCTTSLQVLLGLPLGLEPFTSYSIHFFTQSVSSFRNCLKVPRYFCRLDN